MNVNRRAKKSDMVRRSDLCIMASFTLQVLMLNSDLLLISDLFVCPFTRSFNCDPYLTHVFTLVIASEASRMRCCHLAPPHENNVTCADKTSPAKLEKLVIFVLIFTFSIKRPSKLCMIFFFWTKKLLLHPFKVDISQVDFEKD